MSNTETCRRGHERTPENVRERLLKRNGREHVIRECRPCARLTADARRTAKSASAATEIEATDG